MNNTTDQKLCFAICSNNSEVLDNNFFMSPDIIQGNHQVIIQEGYSSASIAYNNAIARAEPDLVVCLHQDVYLPEGWCIRLLEIISEIEEHDNNWAVLGAYGLNTENQIAGYLYCNANGMLGYNQEPVKVQSLDEVLLVIKKSTGIKFDESFLGFHLYGTDICLIAENQGFSSYAINNIFFHNTLKVYILPLTFWKGIFQIYRKYKTRLPIFTPCFVIDNNIGISIVRAIYRNIFFYFKQYFDKKVSRKTVIEIKKLIEEIDVEDKNE